MSKCLQCGSTVPREAATKRDYDPRTGDYIVANNPRAGKPNVSVDMTRIDPQGLFCTMRCAAKYGVAVAQLSERGAPA